MAVPDSQPTLSKPTSFLALRWRWRPHVLAPDRALFAALRIDRTLLKRVMRIGLPTRVQMVVLSMSALAIPGLANRHESDATAAHGAITQGVSWVQFPSPSIAITAAILGARAIGAGQFEQVPVILRSGLWANAALPGTLVLLGCALSHWFLGLLITQSAVREQAEHLLHIMLWSLLLFGFQTVLGGIVRASGVVTVAISSACIALARMPAAFALSRFGLQRVWAFFSLTHAAMLVLPTACCKLVWNFKKPERLV